MGRLGWFIQGTAHHITMWIGARYGEKFPMHFVCGFPRSGTTWFSEMLADYLNLPRPRHYIFPLGFASIIHTHTQAKHKLNNCFYVVRDGRDTYVSAYFKLMKALQEDVGYVHYNRYLKLFGSNFDPDDIERNLPIYIESAFRRPKNHWGRHVLEWSRKAQESSNQIVLVKYENLLEDACKTFGNAIEQKYGVVDYELVEESVVRHQFSRQRKRPSTQHRTFMRKGISGDWRNHFTQECADLFHHHAGTALIEVGYEKDQSWVAKQPLHLTKERN